MEPANRRRLVKELARLSREDRRAVLREAEDQAIDSPDAPAAEPTLPWASLRAVIGIVHGAPADAVADGDLLYDG